MALLQGRLLEAASRCVKPGGRLIYSTCSLEPEENTGVLEAFAANANGLHLQAQQLTLPTLDADGGFWARFA